MGRDSAWLAAITPEQGVELIAAMESILPVKTLLKFYKAFRAADPAHALVQVRAKTRCARRSMQANRAWGWWLVRRGRQRRRELG